MERGDFEALAQVTGDVIIRDVPDLESIGGFPDLERVGGTLQIYGNDELAAVTGFGSLSATGENLAIRQNPNLTVLTGLGSLVSIGRNLVIADNPSLRSVPGLAGLRSVSGRVSITNNADGFNYSALEGLQCHGGICQDNATAHCPNCPDWLIDLPPCLTTPPTIAPSIPPPSTAPSPGLTPPSILPSMSPAGAPSSSPSLMFRSTQSPVTNNPTPLVPDSSSTNSGGSSGDDSHLYAVIVLAVTCVLLACLLQHCHRAKRRAAAVDPRSWGQDMTAFMAALGKDTVPVVLNPLHASHDHSGALGLPGLQVVRRGGERHMYSEPTDTLGEHVEMGALGLAVADARSAPGLSALAEDNGRCRSRSTPASPIARPSPTPSPPSTSLPGSTQPSPTPSPRPSPRPTSSYSTAATQNQSTADGPRTDSTSILGTAQHYEGQPQYLEPAVGKEQQGAQCLEPEVVQQTQYLEPVKTRQSIYHQARTQEVVFAANPDPPSQNAYELPQNTYECIFAETGLGPAGAQGVTRGGVRHVYSEPAPIEDDVPDAVGVADARGALGL